MEEHLKFYKGICEEQTKRIDELQRILDHNKSIDSTWKKARHNWRKRVMEDKELFNLLKEHKFLNEEGYFIHFTKDPEVEGINK